jgi:hypothetical protein
MTRLPSSISANTQMRRLDFGSLDFRFLVGVDIVGFSQRHAAGQAKAQDDLDSAMTQAAEGAGLNRGRWYSQPRGDGDLAVLPLGINALSLLADYPRKLASAIADANLTNAESRLRVRLAIHHGIVVPGRFGPVGTALVTISRLLDAEAARQHLRRRSDLDVALIVSVTIYDEIVRSRLRDLNPEDFRRITTKAKGVSYIGYIYQDNFGAPDCVIPAPRAPETSELALPRAESAYGDHP